MEGLSQRDAARSNGTSCCTDVAPSVSAAEDCSEEQDELGHELGHGGQPVGECVLPGDSYELDGRELLMFTP